MAASPLGDRSGARGVTATLRFVVAIVNFGMGNLRSVLNALEYLGAEARLADRPDELDGADHVVVPGVGAFRDGINELRQRGFASALPEAARQGTPVLGICLGMQLLATKSFEFGEHEGLNLVQGTVKRLSSNGLSIPHVGWNDIETRKPSRLFEGLSELPTFYFVHSFHLVPEQPTALTAIADHGEPITACVEVDNVYGVQFHPEKSQRDGLKLLENFLALKPVC